MIFLTRILMLITACCMTQPLFGTRANDKTATVQQKGHAYTCFTYWNYSSDHFWNSKGKKMDAFNKFEKDLYQGYAEYGLTWRDTISIKGGWARIEETLNGRNFGFTDIELGWKRYLCQKNGALISAELVAIIPPEEEHSPGLRYGCWGGEINLLMSNGFYLANTRGAYDLRLGYRTYDGDPSDQILADAVGRFMIFPRVCLLAGLNLQYGLLNGHPTRSQQSLFCFFPNYRLLNGKVEVMFNVFKGASIFAGYQRHIWGRNVGTGGEWYAGAQCQF